MTLITNCLLRDIIQLAWILAIELCEFES